MPNEESIEKTEDNLKQKDEQIIVTINCPSCNRKQPSENKFCEKCGQDFASEKIKSKFKNRRDLRPSKEKREKRVQGANINDGRIMILVIAISSFVFYLVGMHIINIFLNMLQEEHEFLMDENDRNIFHMLTFIPLGMGFVYIGLFFWSFKNNFAALLVTLILYLIETSLILLLGFLPHPYVLALKLVIIFFLALSVKASIKLKAQGKNLGNK